MSLFRATRRLLALPRVSNEQALHFEKNLKKDIDRKMKQVGSGTFEYRQAETVTVFQPAHNAMQNSIGTNPWVVKVDKCETFINPVNGWPMKAAASFAPLPQFRSCEDAVAFAESQGYSVTVLPAQQGTFKKKAYSDNFRWKGHPKEEENYSS